MNPFLRDCYLEEARVSAGKAVGCVFEVVTQICGYTGVGDVAAFANARAFAAYAEMNADYALECAAKAAP